MREAASNLRGGLPRTKQQKASYCGGFFCPIPHEGVG